jgi:hypothetical protein
MIRNGSYVSSPCCGIELVPIEPTLLVCEKCDAKYKLIISSDSIRRIID